MSNRVIIAEDPFEPQKWERFQDVDDVLEFLTTKFARFPETARIYHGQVAEANDVTPRDEASIQRLAQLEGTFYIIVYPAGVLAAGYLIIALFAVAAVVALSGSPDPPNVADRNINNASPNNSLSERTNSARLLARIPDIFGQVISTPDLIALPYKVYESNVEFEYAYMCVGKGEYEILEDSVKDGDTQINNIDGAAVNIYGPNTSPNSGDDPQLTIPAGEIINELVLSVSRINAVNGQTLKAPNQDIIVGSNNIRFGIGPDIESGDGTGKDIDFSDIFTTSSSFPGDDAIVTNASLTITPTGATNTTVYTYSVRAYYSNFSYATGTLIFSTPAEAGLFPADTVVILTDAVFDDGVNPPFDLNGVYVVASSDIVTGRVNLRYPTGVNSNWGNVHSYYPGRTTEIRNIDIEGSNNQIGVNLDVTMSVGAGEEDGVSYLRDLEGKDTPYILNSDWVYLFALADQKTQLFSPSIQRDDIPWIGPFDITREDNEEVWCNFVANNGLYKDNGSVQTSLDVELELELTPINTVGDPTGPAETFSAIVVGSATLRSIKAVTIKAQPTFTGPCRVRARRVDDTDLAFNGQVSDEIKWKDAYSVAVADKTDFGDVTTVLSKTQATEGALNVKNRKLNMEVTRKIPLRISGDDFQTFNTATTNAAEIISFVCLDPKIGGRTKDEIDFDNIYDTIAEVYEYFSSGKTTATGGDFSYTFDNENISFEETLSSIAAAAFCTAYRQGSKIKIKLEEETDDSLMLFNHRNKVPASETRGVRFGNLSDYDGIELEYVDPENDLVEKIYLPDDQSAVTPKKIETIGVRGRLHAYFHAHRAWNKLQYQNADIEFKATQEAFMVGVKDRVLVADNTRPDIQDGEVISQEGLELTLSQDVDLTTYPSYSIHLQHIDGSVENIDIVAGTNSNQVVLAQAPTVELQLDPEFFTLTTYLVVGNIEQAATAFLISEKSNDDNFVSSITAINYDSRYYGNDKDYINDIIDEEGEVIGAGQVDFSPAPGSFLLQVFPIDVTITKRVETSVIRWSKTTPPLTWNDGTEYTGPVSVNAFETLYAKAFASENDGGPLTGGLYDAV